jgi:hypothetical protein
MAGYRSVAISEDDRAICGDWPQALDRSSKRILIDGLPLDEGEPIATNACGILAICVVGQNPKQRMY